MLNYVSAELYKLTRKKGLFVGVGLLLLLESLLFIPGAFLKEELQNLADAYLAFLGLALGLGLLLAPLFAARSFDDQHGNGTFKNEIVYGIPRSRIYLGKLLTGMLAGTVSAVAVMGWYLLLVLLFTRPGPDSVWWGVLWRTVGTAWLSWLSALSFAFFLMMRLKSSAAAIVASYLVTILGTPLALTVGSDPGSPAWACVLSRLFYGYACLYQIDLLAGDAGGSIMAALGNTLASCGIWTLGLTALGMFLFQRQEIK